MDVLRIMLIHWNRRAIASIPVILTLGLCPYVLEAQPGLTYTPDQAVRGERAYADACASCHGKALEGQSQAPPLAGDEFLMNWDKAPIADLFDKIQVTMPGDRPGQLSRQQTADILAYILAANKVPPGSSELPSAEDGLKGVQFNAPH